MSATRIRFASKADLQFSIVLLPCSPARTVMCRVHRTQLLQISPELLPPTLEDDRAKGTTLIDVDLRA
jgi:hypothetical protein